jgi:hypothetical protein
MTCYINILSQFYFTPLSFMLRKKERKYYHWKNLNFKVKLRFFFWNGNKISLGVSICLDRVSIESLNLDVVKECVSTVEKISTASKSAPLQSRNLGPDRDFSISSQHQCPDQKASIEIEKFIEIWKFQHFSTICLDLGREVRGFLHFLIEISQSVKTFHHFQTQKVSTMSRFLNNVKISQQILTASQQVSTILTKISTEKSRF